MSFVKLPNDLKRIAGMVNKEGWYTSDDKEAVGGTVTLSGPVLLFDSKPVEYGAPGFYSREDIEKAIYIMYGF